MKRFCLICCGTLLAALTCAAQEPIPPVKPIPPVDPIPPVKSIPEVKPIPEMKPIPDRGSNVKRNADTKPKRPSKTPGDCRSSASQIRKDYGNAKSEDEKRQLRRDLSDLAEQCGGWGNLGGGPIPPDSKSGNANSGSGSNGASGGASSDGGATVGGSGGGGSTSPPPPPRPIGGSVANAILVPVHTKPALPIPKGLPTTLVRDKAARQHLSDAWRQVAAAQAKVRPRQDTDKEAQASTPSVPEPAGASEIARNGLASVAQMEREAAALNAYALTQSRYLAAQQRGDQDGMALQAKLMPKFIDMATDAAHAAARSRAAADKLILDEMERRQAGAAKAGGWGQAAPNLGSLSASDLPPGVLSEMKSSGMQTQGVSKLLGDLNSMKPSDINASIAALRAQVKADNANGPQPPDLARLEHERVKAQALASKQGVTARP